MGQKGGVINWEVTGPCSREGRGGSVGGHGSACVWPTKGLGGMRCWLAHQGLGGLRCWLAHQGLGWITVLAGPPRAYVE